MIMARMDNTTQDADIDIGRLFGALWRDKFLIVAGIVIITGLAFLLLSSMTPKYRSEARLLIESSESIFTRPQGSDQRSDTTSSLLDPEGIASQVEILRSSDLLMQVASDLKLDENEEFNPTGSMSSLKAGMVALGLIEDPKLVSPEKRILDAINERLDVYTVPKSRVIGIGFTSQDKELAAKFPNALAAAYLELQSKAQLDSTGKAADYLADEINDLKESVREAEAAVADFRASSDLLIGDGTNSSVLATQQLGQLSSELSRVRAERSSAEAKARSIKAALDGGASIDSLSDVLQSELIRRLREREIGLQTELADLSVTLLPGHPRIKGLKSQIADLSRRIRDEARKVLAGVRNEAEIAGERERELTDQLNALKVASANANEREVELRALEREAASQRALLESYLGRYREAQSRDEGQYAPATARLISRAVVPAAPVFPKMIPMLGAAFFVSALVMMLTTLVREIFSGRAFVPAAAPMNVVITREPSPSEEEPEDRIEEVEIPIAVTPRAEPAPLEHIETQSSASDEYGVDALVAHLVESGADRAILVSPEGDAGASASVAVARALADEGLRTVLVDLTSSGAASRRMLADTECPGITDLLAASSSYSDVIYADYATGAHVIPTGTADPVKAMRAADRLPIILDALVSAYDVVIVECGPTNAEGLKRLTGDSGQVAISVADPASPEIVETAENLVAAGYEDLTLVTAAGADEMPPQPESRQTFAR